MDCKAQTVVIAVAIARICNEAGRPSPQGLRREHLLRASLPIMHAVMNTTPPNTTPLPRLILASTSPYRRDMLARLQLPFGVVAPEVDETPLPGELPDALALRLAASKAQTVAHRHPGCVVIGSDQVATVEDDTIGKPGGHAAARAQLRRLSGRMVAFHTALAVTDGVRMQSCDVVTTCRFRDLSDAAIESYLLRERPYDTAGSAKAEGLGIALMATMQSTDPTAIIGLPLIALTTLLAEFGLHPLENLPD